MINRNCLFGITGLVLAASAAPALAGDFAFSFGYSRGGCYAPPAPVYYDYGYSSPVYYDDAPVVYRDSCAPRVVYRDSYAPPVVYRDSYAPPVVYRDYYAPRVVNRDHAPRVYQSSRVSYSRGYDGYPRYYRQGRSYRGGCR